MDKKSYATVSLVFGILSIITGCFCLGGFFGVLGIIFFICSYKSTGKTNSNIAGLITSIIGIIIALVMFIFILTNSPSDSAADITTVQESTTEVTTETTTTAPTEEDNNISENISPDKFIEDVRTAIEGQVGKNETIKNVTLENRNLCVYVDLSRADPSPLTFEDLAFSRTSSITDSILGLTKYESFWDTITIDFGDIGYILNNKDNVVNGNHFSSENFKLEHSKSDISEDNTTESNTEQLVWIPKSGHKYHSNSSCSNMKNPSQVSKTDAENMGYTPCKKCY